MTLIYRFFKRFLFFCLVISASVYAQPTENVANAKLNNFKNVHLKLPANKVAKGIKIDGLLNEAAWKEASKAANFIEFRPTPFKEEQFSTRTETFIMYNNEGIYIGGRCFEPTKDSVSRELIGRDGFGNNDFFGVTFDTYLDKQNGFNYFVTPLGEQMDAKVGNFNEDWSWNAVWESASTIDDNGWTFEIFVPFSAIRFGKGKEQKWGINFTRRRVKTGQQTTWNPIDQQVNGYLTQAGVWEGLSDIKPPIRLQFSPYVSAYSTVFSKVEPGEKKVVSQLNGGMDVKYGINQAFTLDMALIPDFGQVQTDNRVLNLGPFEQQFSEQRPFFTEGLELFSKGNLFYSRRIGKNPTQASYDYYNSLSNETIKDPQETKIVNATKVSGRTQKGLGIGILNAVTNKQFATFTNTITGATRKVENFPLTNYNMIVIDQTLKNNSSVSFVNTNVLRNGTQYDANVSMGLFDFNDKTNTYNIGGKVGVSNLIGFYGNGKTKTGYTQSIYMGKTSGQFNFNLWSDLTNANYSQNDMGYATNNNFFDKGIYAGYAWNKPKGFYNRIRINFNSYLSHILTTINPLKPKRHMFQEFNQNFNINGQTKKLWYFGVNGNIQSASNDYYEARTRGRVFKKGRGQGIGAWLGSNDNKKYSANTDLFFARNQLFNANYYSIGIGQKIRFNQKFSVDHYLSLEGNKNQAGFGSIIDLNNVIDSIVFTRRNRQTIQNNLNVKYSFTNKMFITLNLRHYWSGVKVRQTYLLNEAGKMVPLNPVAPSTLNQNYNALAINLVYTYQIANGSFLNIVWKDEADEFVRQNFEPRFAKNLNRTLDANHANSFSIRLIYFIDYLQLKGKKKV